jgi:hypothetical protein
MLGMSILAVAGYGLRRRIDPASVSPSGPASSRHCYQAIKDPGQIRRDRGLALAKHPRRIIH